MVNDNPSSSHQAVDGVGSGGCASLFGAHSSFLTHAIAILVVLIWGCTFVNTKHLIHAGLQPHEIFVLRFLMAYGCIWLLPGRRLWADSVADELLMVVLGMTGGSLYFLTENEAVGLTLVSNVSFIVCTAPLITTLLAIAIARSVRASSLLIGGSLVALAGVAVVVFNGQYVLHLSPRGDLLALAAAVAWAVYSLLMKRASGRYSAVFITRKVFFYGLLTALPIFCVRPWTQTLSQLMQPAVAAHLLFLGIVASFACFVTWSWAIARIGAMKASNYIYLNPVSTLVAGIIWLGEPTTWLGFAGCVLILAGVWIANRAKDI